jgi:hypothetical protein
MRNFYGEDLSILRKTRITETIALELRADIFNPFNRSRVEPRGTGHGEDGEHWEN